MKVFTVWYGSYSGRELDGIFSTKEKADSYLERMKKCNEFGEYDDKPIEYDIDTQKPPERIKADVYYDGNVFFLGEPFEYEKEYITDQDCIVFINWNPDPEVMKQAARDKAHMLKARKAGI